MKKSRVCKIDSPDGEIHFILDEFLHIEHFKYLKDSDVTEIKKTSKKEASRPLALIRQE